MKKILFAALYALLPCLVFAAGSMPVIPGPGVKSYLSDPQPPATNLYARWVSTTGITESGGAISSWVDTENSFDVTQATEVSKPKLSTDGASRPVVSFPFSSATPSLLTTFLAKPTDFSIPVPNSTVWVVHSGTHDRALQQTPVSLGISGTGGPHGWTRINAGSTVNNIPSFEDKASTMPSVPVNIHISGRHSTAANTTYVMDASGISANLGTPYSNGSTYTGVALGRNIRDADEIFKGDIYEVLIYTPAQSTEDLDATRTYLKSKYSVKADGSTTEYTSGQIVIDGDSITAGYGAVNNKSYGRQTAELKPNWKVMTLGVVGDTISGLTAKATKIDAIKNTSKYSSNVLMILIGRNDVKTQDAATVYANLVTYCQARVAAGWTVWVGTVIGTTVTAEQAKIVTLNNSIRSSLITDAGIAKVIDFAAHADLDDATAAANTTYYTDGTHPTAAGYTIMANILAGEM